MCGRAYTTFTQEELTLRYFNRKPVKLPELKSNYNLSPTQSSTVLLQKDEDLISEVMTWGLIPSWAKDPKIAFKTINARSETVDQKPAFRDAFERRRCLVPLSGFIEWKRGSSGEKQPFKIFGKHDSILSMAGLWETWKPAQGEEVHTFTLLTTEPNSLMSEIHDRMPVILGKDEERIWLNPLSASPQALKQLLKPCPSDWLEAVEISPLINNPKNNRPELLNPHTAPRQGTLF